MKYVQFVMSGDTKYVTKCMDDEAIQENMVRNIQGAAQIGGRVRITVSDKGCEELLSKRLRNLGITESEMGSVEMVDEKRLLKNCKKFFEAGDPRGAEKFKALMQLKKDPQRKGMYYDTIKMLSIHDAPEGQVVEFADLDQQIDITKNPDFKFRKDVPLATSMHLGEHSNDHNYRRHDMNEKELIAYGHKNSGVSNRAYTNERSYMVGRGGDRNIMMNVFMFVGNLPHIFVGDHFMSLDYNQRVALGSRGISDAEMSSDLRDTLIKKYHIDFNETSLMERERAQGKEVGFEHAEKEKPTRSKKQENRKSAYEVGNEGNARGGSIFAEAAAIDNVRPGDFTFNPQEQIGNGKDNSIPNNVVGDAFAAALIGAAYLARRLFRGGGNNNKPQGKGGR